MPGFFDENSRNYYTQRRWFYWLFSAINFLAVLVIGILRYPLLYETMDGFGERINGEASQTENNQSVVDYFLPVSSVLLVLPDLWVLSYMIRKLRPTYSSNIIKELLQESEDRSETSQAFKASLQTALARQGYDNSGDELLVRYYRDIDDCILSVSSVYKNRFLGNKKYLLLNIYPQTFDMWRYVESKPNYAHKMYVFNHEAAHIAAGHAVPWQSTSVLGMLVKYIYLVQSLIVSMLCLVTEIAQAPVFPDTPAVNAFKILSLISVGMFLFSQVMKLENRSSVATEHAADRAAVTEVAKEYPDYDFPLRPVDGIKRATCSCGLFKQPMYMTREELIAARDYERQRAGLLGSVKTDGNHNVSYENREEDNVYTNPNDCENREQEESGVGFASVGFNNGAGRAST